MIQVKPNLASGYIRAASPHTMRENHVQAAQVYEREMENVINEED